MESTPDLENLKEEASKLREELLKVCFNTNLDVFAANLSLNALF